MSIGEGFSARCKAVFTAWAASVCVSFTAAATVVNLESYHLRHDFSTGRCVFTGGARCANDFVINSSENNGVAVKGPNGPASAFHPTSGCSGCVSVDGSAVNPQYLATNDWTLAMCLHPGNREKGVLFAIGRQNTSKYRSALSLCSSSDPTKLYLYDTYRKSSGTEPGISASKEITGLANMTNGFHTVVLSYEKASSNVTVYVDGTSRLNYRVGNGNASCYIGEYVGYCNEVSKDLPELLSTYEDHDVSFYDVRFYFGAFDANDATAYAALYPVGRMGAPLRPNAYLQTSATNITANATVGNYIDTGYFAKGAETRFIVDYQFLDVRGQSRIFGARGNFVQGLYVRGYDKTGDLAWNFMGESKWVTSNKGAGRLRRIATFDRVGKVVAVTNFSDRISFYFNDSHNSLKAETGDADYTTYLFAENVENAAACFGKARIYSFRIDENGVPVHFLAPTVQDGEAGFKDVITGTFHGDGNKDNNPERPLLFCDGIGSAKDYKYEDSALYAKLYATAGSGGTVRVAGGEPAVECEGWIPFGEPSALTAVPSDKTRFLKWIGDTWAIADGYSVMDASICVQASVAIQLRATFASDIDAKLTIGEDGNDIVHWETAEWRSDDENAIPVSAPAFKNVTIEAHKSVTVVLDKDVSLDTFTVQADENCAVTFAVYDKSSFLANEVVVAQGVLRQGTANAFGTTPNITVKPGGTFDVNGLAPSISTSFNIKGAGAGDWPWALTSSKDGSTEDSSIDIVKLYGDAAIGGSHQICVGVRNKRTFYPEDETKPLTLNGHTLTKAGSGKLLLRRPYSTNEGVIDVRSGELMVKGWSNENAAYAQSCLSNITLVACEGTTVRNELNNPLYFKTIDMDGAAFECKDGKAFGVTSFLLGHGSVEELVMPDGAAYRPDGLGFLEIVRSVPESLNIDFDSIGSLTMPVLSVPESLESQADQALASLPKGWKFVKNMSDGYIAYTVVKKGFAIAIR